MTSWPLAAETAGKKKVLPAKYKNESEIDAKTPPREIRTKKTTAAIKVLAAIIIFLRSKRSAANPASAINKKLGVASERTIPDTAKLLPVFAKTEEIREINRKAEAIWPRNKVSTSIKKSLLFRTSI